MLPEHPAHKIESLVCLHAGRILTLGSTALLYTEVMSSTLPAGMCVSWMFRSVRAFLHSHSGVS